MWTMLAVCAALAQSEPAERIEYQRNRLVVDGQPADGTRAEQRRELIALLSASPCDEVQRIETKRKRRERTGGAVLGIVGASVIPLTFAGPVGSVILMGPMFAVYTVGLGLGIAGSNVQPSIRAYNECSESD